MVMACDVDLIVIIVFLFCFVYIDEEDLTFAISEGSVEFNWTRFALEFIYNLFHWLALPLIVYNEGWTGARSRCYWGFNFGRAFMIWAGIMNLFFWFMNISV